MSITQSHSHISSRSNLFNLSQSSTSIQPLTTNQCYQKFISKLGVLMSADPADLDTLYKKVEQCVKITNGSVSDKDVNQLIEIAQQLKNNHNLLKGMVKVLDEACVRRRNYASKHSNAELYTTISNSQRDKEKADTPVVKRVMEYEAKEGFLGEEPMKTSDIEEKDKIFLKFQIQSPNQLEQSTEIVIPTQQPKSPQNFSFSASFSAKSDIKNLIKNTQQSFPQKLHDTQTLKLTRQKYRQSYIKTEVKQPERKIRNRSFREKVSKIMSEMQAIKSKLVQIETQPTKPSPLKHSPSVPSIIDSLKQTNERNGNIRDDEQISFTGSWNKQSPKMFNLRKKLQENHQDTVLKSLGSSFSPKQAQTDNEQVLDSEEQLRIQKGFARVPHLTKLRENGENENISQKEPEVEQGYKTRLIFDRGYDIMNNIKSVESKVEISGQSDSEKEDRQHNALEEIKKINQQFTMMVNKIQPLHSEKKSHEIRTPSPEQKTQYPRRQRIVKPKVQSFQLNSSKSKPQLKRNPLHSQNAVESQPLIQKNISTPYIHHGPPLPRQPVISQPLIPFRSEIKRVSPIHKLSNISKVVHPEPIPIYRPLPIQRDYSIVRQYIDHTQSRSSFRHSSSEKLKESLIDSQRLRGSRSKSQKKGIRLTSKQKK